METVPPLNSLQAQGSRILVAEDNKINQIVLIRQLEKLGYAADHVENGYEVLKTLRHQTYDLILMDCQMPRMDGYEADGRPGSARCCAGRRRYRGRASRG